MERYTGSLNEKKYKPFRSVKNFSIRSDTQGVVRYVDFKNSTGSRAYTLQIDDRSMTPRDGLLMTNYLSRIVHDKKVLDLGTGSGVLAIHSAVFGAKKIVGIDIDTLALAAARNNSELNGLDLEWRESDLFSNVNYKDFDLILSNPPQLPMKSGMVKDAGGNDGRGIVKRIIMQSPSFLAENGVLLMVLFDFLGVDQTYNNDPPLKDLFHEKGFDLTILKREKATVRKGGQTEKSSNHILETYPRYRFGKNGNNIVHEKFLIRAQLKEKGGC